MLVIALVSGQRPKWRPRPPPVPPLPQPPPPPVPCPPPPPPPSPSPPPRSPPPPPHSMVDPEAAVADAERAPACNAGLNFSACWRGDNLTLLELYAERLYADGQQQGTALGSTMLLLFVGFCAGCSCAVLLCCGLVLRRGSRLNANRMTEIGALDRSQTVLPGGGESEGAARWFRSLCASALSQENSRLVTTEAQQARAAAEDKKRYDELVRVGDSHHRLGEASF